MDADHIAFTLGTLGLVPAALEDGLRRAEAHFREHPYTPEAAQAWAEAQRLSAAHLFGQPAQASSTQPPVWEQLGMSEEAFTRMPPAWRLAQGRNLQPPPVHSRRPTSRPLSAEELTTLEGLPWAERRERGRQGVVSTVARKPPLSVAMAIFGILCNGLQPADTPPRVPSVTT
jgi:hypothetical protein